MMFKVLIADDEPLARRRLRSLVSRVPWTQVIGEASDGDMALSEIRRLRPDIVFLDVRMPESSGLDVLAQLRVLSDTPAVVFATAFETHAVAAFELQAVDYLLKPIREARFLQAIDHARTARENSEARDQLERASAILSDVEADNPLNRIFVRAHGRILSVSPTDIEHIEAQDDYALVHAQGAEYLIAVRMHELERRLPQPPFLRVHRSHIINIDHMAGLYPASNGRLIARLHNGDAVQVSRTKARDIRKWAR